MLLVLRPHSPQIAITLTFISAPLYLRELAQANRTHPVCPEHRLEVAGIEDTHTPERRG